MNIAIIGAPHVGKHDIKDQLTNKYKTLYYKPLDDIDPTLIETPEELLAHIHLRYGRQLLQQTIQQYDTIIIETPIEALGVYTQRHGTPPQHTISAVKASVATYDAIIYVQPYKTLSERVFKRMEATERMKINDIIGNTKLETDNKIVIVLETGNHKRILHDIKHHPTLRQWLHHWNRNVK